MLACKRISFFTDMRMLHALAWPILLLGRAHATRPHVHREGHKWLVVQDLIGVCHMHTYVHKKIPRHMNFRSHTRNTAKSSDEIAFSGSLQRQWDGTFAHCEVHNGWWLPCRVYVYVGSSDQMLYQHITVLTLDITASCSFYLQKIWRFASVTWYTVKSNEVQVSV
jgi:hypothetical protein